MTTAVVVLGVGASAYFGVVCCEIIYCAAHPEDSLKLRQ